jgi:hypothetical protein
MKTAKGMKQVQGFVYCEVENVIAFGHFLTHQERLGGGGGRGVCFPVWVLPAPLSASIGGAISKFLAKAVSGSVCL